MFLWNIYFITKLQFVLISIQWQNFRISIPHIGILVDGVEHIERLVSDQLVLQVQIDHNVVPATELLHVGVPTREDAYLLVVPDYPHSVPQLGVGVLEVGLPLLRRVVGRVVVDEHDVVVGVVLSLQRREVVLEPAGRVHFGLCRDHADRCLVRHFVGAVLFVEVVVLQVCDCFWLSVEHQITC